MESDAFKAARSPQDLKAFDSMQSQAIAVGREYIRAEQRLDSLFAAGGITSEGLQEGVAEAERLKGRLRVIHLAAHLETTALMDPDQVSRYQHLRGPGYPFSSRRKRLLRMPREQACHSLFPQS